MGSGRRTIIACYFSPGKVTKTRHHFNWRVGKWLKLPLFDSGIRRFKSYHANHFKFGMFTGLVIGFLVGKFWDSHVKKEAKAAYAWLKKEIK